MTTQLQGQPGKVYIPSIGDHCEAIAAALRAYGQPAEVLPATSPATLATGLEVGKGRECMFSLMIIGGMLHRAKQSDFDPERSALFFPSLSRKCVGINYSSLFRDALANNGLEQVEILSPGIANTYRGMGSHPDVVRSLIWHGFIAIDLLIRLQNQRRPYELQPGATDLAYQRSLARVVAAIETGEGSRVVAALAASASEFEAVPLDQSVRRPRIGMLGDFYMLYNPYLYLDAIRQIEALGGEVEILRFAKFFYFINWMREQDARGLGKHQDALQIALENAYQHQVEADLVATVRHLLSDANPLEPRATVTVADIQRYYHIGIVNGGFTAGAAVDMAREGCAGLLHVVPFLCIGSIIAAALGNKVRTDLGQIPWLDIIFDAQGGTNVRTRLEAFLFQAAQFDRSKAGAQRAVPPPAERKLSETHAAPPRSPRAAPLIPLTVQPAGAGSNL
ncbi:MAG: hypothetical protein HGA45_06395 [Chloroflexales bacterium]|nr:hypothetical protein [Chloroflexales bacterium]